MQIDALLATRTFLADSGRPGPSSRTRQVRLQVKLLLLNMIEKIPQDFGGGEGVAQSLLLFVGSAAAGHLLIGGEARQPFIVIMHVKAASQLQLLAELASQLRLRTLGAVHIQRKAEDDRSGRMVFDRIDNRINQRITARDLNHRQRRGDVRLVVPDRQSCAFVPKIDRQIAPGKGRS